MTDQMRELVYPPEAFAREDEGDDAEFYATDRFVSHLDTGAQEVVARLIGSLVSEERPDILDLMASWDSHLPAGLATGRVVGLGLNANELARNEALTERVVHDLNREPRLPFDDASFDLVLNVVSVDYLVRPFEVFADVVRVLRPGGMHLVVFSNRFFPPKVVKVWREAAEHERMIIVEDYFQASELYTESRNWSDLGRPRPADDKYAGQGLPGDPVHAVWAERTGGPAGRPERRPPAPDVVAVDPEELDRRKAAVRRSRRCPHCDEPLATWAVPETPFIEFEASHLWVCFNDRCPYLAEGWEVMRRQGNAGFSHRLMFNPITGQCKPLPVPSLAALRENIVADPDG